MVLERKKKWIRMNVEKEMEEIIRVIICKDKCILYVFIFKVIVCDDYK